ncbi:MAG: peptidoglycan DD-metalloendopeptidase family protein, partial [Actinomycetota bacterium]
MSVLAAARGTAHVYSYGGWANCWVAIDHADGWQTRYYHLKNVDASINNQAVSAGRRLGDAGQPGSETCGSGSPNFRHVHFSIWRNGARVAIDGTSIGGYTVHETGSTYCGYWTRDSDGAIVADARTRCLAVPSLVNNILQPGGEHYPTGNLDSATRSSPTSIRVAGWAADADAGGSPINVHFLLDGFDKPIVADLTANQSRSDVGPHGFSGDIPTDGAAHTVCAVAVDVGGPGDSRLPPGCLPIGPARDEQPPSVPTGLGRSSSDLRNYVGLSWQPSTDNVGVAGYEVFKNGAYIGTTGQTAFEDKTPFGSDIVYTYQVRAFDAAGNRSGLSSGIDVRTSALNAGALSFADFNGDHAADYCRAFVDVSGQHVACTLSTGPGLDDRIGTTPLADTAPPLDSRASFGVTVSSPALDWGYDTDRAWADFNGDGKADYCRRVGDVYPRSRVQCTVSTGTAFGATYTSGAVNWGAETGRRWVD